MPLLLNSVLVAAVSRDGKIATKEGDQRVLTNDADRRHLREQMGRADLLLLARRTYEKHVTELNSQRCAVMTTQTTDLTPIAINRFYWNPAHMPFEDLCARLKSERVCILGGSALYT